MNEPYLKHEMIADLWDFESPLMDLAEILSLAELGYKLKMEDMSEEKLKDRYSSVIRLINFYEGDQDDEM